MARQATAEFRKIAGARATRAFQFALPVGTFLFAFEVFHLEDALAHATIPGMFEALPIVYFVSWKSMLFQFALVAFSAFWATLDSQYGMIRVACTQPVSRAEYLVGKWMGIGAHVAVLSVIYVASLMAWASIYAGVGDLTHRQAAALLRFSAEVVWFSVAFAGLGMAAASFRRTIGSGIVTGIITIVLVAFMTTVPFDVLPPQFVFMRYFSFPLGELPNPWPAGADSPFVRMGTMVGFLSVVPATPLVLSALALLHFRSRDITE